MPEYSLYAGRVFALVIWAFVGIFDSSASFAETDSRLINSWATSDDQAAYSYVIGPQNVIQIKIFGDASTNQIYRVDERGYIKHALLGSLKIGGLSVAATEKLIETMLAGDYFVDPRVTIFVLEYSRFSVIGEVRKPGTFEIVGGTSVIEAVSMAGGFTPVANQSGVKIIRKEGGVESTIEVNAKHITEQGDVRSNVYISAGDVIVVPKSFF